jgi:ABC-2 type transport system permease protein
VGDLAVYRHLLAATVRSDWQYRASFALYVVGQALATAADLAAVLVLLASVPALAGWSAEEVVFLYGVAGFGFGLADLFISQVEDVAAYVKSGRFDSLLIRPMGALWQLSAREFALRRVGRSIPPIVVLVVVLGRLDVDWTVARALLVPVTVVSAALIFGSLWVVTCSIAFWTVETQEVANTFTYGGAALTRYPIDVFGSWLRRLVVFVVPLASTAYLPGCILFDHPMPDGLPRWVAWTGPAVAVLWVLLARGVWRLALRHYRSTGS